MNEDFHYAVRCFFWKCLECKSEVHYYENNRLYGYEIEKKESFIKILTRWIKILLRRK